MIKSPITLKGKTKPVDDSAALSKDELVCVLAAMDAGLEEFTVPTPGDDQGKTDWRVGQMVYLRDKAPVTCLVAYQVTAAHFRVMGPELPLSKPNGLQKRA